MKTRVYVTLKNGVLDPQGKAIHHALEGLGFEGVNGVRAGKLIELDLEPGVDEAQVEDMCRKLLANTVIENFRIENEEIRIEPSEGSRGDASRGGPLL
jgi:phosphoribosylformylglycinamidine synthase